MLERVQQYKYLGLVFDAKPDLQRMANQRLKAANLGHHALIRQLQQKAWRDKFIRILLCNVYTGTRIRHTGSARHDAHAGPPCQFAIGLGHHCRTAFLAAREEAQPIAALVYRIENGEVAFAGHAKHVLRAMGEQLVDEDLPARSQIRHSPGALKCLLRPLHWSA